MVIRFTAILAAVMITLPAVAAEVVLSQRDVAELVLKQSYQAQEVNLQAEQQRLPLYTVLKNFDFQLAASGYYEKSKFEGESTASQDETLVSSVSLTKLFSTGTTVGVSYTRNADRYVFPTGVTIPTTLPGDRVTQDVLGLTVQQNLLADFFGVADRADIRSANATFNAAMINRVTNLQDLVLSGIQSYWNAYVAQQTFQQTLAARGRYQKLAEAVRRKTKYGYANPGEAEQAEAELEGQEQNVKAASVNYLAALDNLITLLRLPRGSDIRFQVPTDIPPLPKLPGIDIENLRPLRSSKLNLQAAEDALRSANSRTYPNLAFVGQLYSQGYDAKASDSYSEMVSGTNPKYYIGLQLTYNFGSGYNDELVLNRKVTRDLAEDQLQRQRLQLKDQEADLTRRVQSTYLIAQSLKSQRSWSEKAARGLTRTYNQGRTDISVLITAIDKYFQSEVDYARSIGNYQIALNQWAAFRDELIPDTKETKE
jgi:outer membrane protein TolC